MTIQRETTEAKAPSVSAEETSNQIRALRHWRGQRGTIPCKGLPERCQPKVMVRVAGRVESHREKRLPIMLPMSASKWAASVMMAKLWAKYPPAGEMDSLMLESKQRKCVGMKRKRAAARAGFSQVPRLQVLFLVSPSQ